MKDALAQEFVEIEIFIRHEICLDAFARQHDRREAADMLIQRDAAFPGADAGRQFLVEVFPPAGRGAAAIHTQMKSLSVADFAFLRGCRHILLAQRPFSFTHIQHA